MVLVLVVDHIMVSHVRLIDVVIIVVEMVLVMLQMEVVLVIIHGTEMYASIIGCSHNCSGHGTCNVANGNCSCDDGYHETNNYKACTINQCRCPGGTKVDDGPSCLTHNQIKCKSCGTGFKLDNSRCKCNKDKFKDTWDECKTCKGDLTFSNGQCTCPSSCTNKSRAKCHELLIITACVIMVIILLAKNIIKKTIVIYILLRV